MIVERFRDQLEELERERVKLARDRKGYLFLLTMTAFLGTSCVASGAWSGRVLLVSAGAFLLIGADLIRRIRFSLDENYRQKFRDRVTRVWFHEQFPDIYLAAPSPDQMTVEVLRGFREACAKVTFQDPLRTVIEERVFFESDSSQSWMFVFKEKRRFSARASSRAVVRFHEGKYTGFRWPGSSILAAPLTTSCLLESSYSSWMADARRLIGR